MTNGDPPRKNDRLLRRILDGTSDANIRFGDLRNLLIRLGFRERIRGSHHIFARDDIPDNINIQPSRGQVKPYQIQQVRRVFEKYGIAE